MDELTFQRDGDTIRGLLARPDGNGPFPGLILIPDVRGIYDHYRDVAARFAAEGFFTYVVDLYSREGAPDLPDLAAVFAWIAALPDARVLADLDAAAQHLALHAEVKRGGVGITGFCLGGQYALMAACRAPALRACVSWYGMLRYAELNAHKPASPLDLAPQLRCPYLGLFGADDALIPVADVEALRDILQREHKTFDIEIYRGAGHGFFNEARPATFNAAAAADAFPRAVRFLHQHLA